MIPDSTKTEQLLPQIYLSVFESGDRGWTDTGGKLDILKVVCYPRSWKRNSFHTMKNKSRLEAVLVTENSSEWNLFRQLREIFVALWLFNNATSLRPSNLRFRHIIIQYGKNIFWIKFLYTFLNESKIQKLLNVCLFKERAVNKTTSAM
jgi:hypothetical protein